MLLREWFKNVHIQRKHKGKRMSSRIYSFWIHSVCVYVCGGLWQRSIELVIYAGVKPILHV